MTNYEYTDAYLAPLVTDERAARAAVEVASLGTFPADWTDRLNIQRAYIITCLESQKSADDVFAAKLSAYRKEFEQTLSGARGAQLASNTSAAMPNSAGSIFSIGLERS